jgi:DNA mismatch endonuclease, patch repair protein
MPGVIPAKDGRPTSSHRKPRGETAQASFASTAMVRARMQRQRTRDTAPELALRRILHAQGLRFRVDRAPIALSRRRADIVFTRLRVAVYVDGCFWHGCPQHGTRSKSNTAWWDEKLERNRARDADTDRMLAEAGWIVIRIWEHEDTRSAAESVCKIVRSRLAVT